MLFKVYLYMIFSFSVLVFILYHLHLGPLILIFLIFLLLILLPITVLIFTKDMVSLEDFSQTLKFKMKHRHSQHYQHHNLPLNPVVLTIAITLKSCKVMVVVSQRVLMTGSLHCHPIIIKLQLNLLWTNQKL